ncbi:MAG: nucleoid-structuring protein H-NS [Armatimonadetes bacterium]|nr:nucleoid-structuring protein H-NS [Armatimonadota bacterium]NIM24321.1 nucleoid-structuring protein H-NS [Armatimonadota bacterium]NIM68190.1 nucleoid-structuring protein H-NS [Armatimonadota bacterium]NIM76650.1 nucleoid-structuring protein H-NS [Armatimonadota bacterium]NIN06395.1 nucleoid-structuring protein H-NS [Armatimonadota bacterium]
MVHKKDKEAKGSWVTYRPEIKLLDCTIRDGGLMNEHQFEDGFVKAVYETCIAAGIDYVELGYKASKKIFAPDKFGDWKYCDEDCIRRIVGDNSAPIKLSAMADAEKTDYHEDILPKEQSVFDVIRVATYIHQIPTAIDMIKDAHDKGYETTLNLMAISVVHDSDLAEALEVLVKTPVGTIYLVDSFGSLYSEQIRDLTLTYLDAVKGTGKEVGIHAHNNQQLAYANTIEALILGANRIDATINGMGRGAGNCSLELLLAFLKNPKFKLRPVLECIQKHFLPLRDKMEWGYRVPYMLTGMLNQHPRAAMTLRASKNPDDYVGFYDQLTEKE